MISFYKKLLLLLFVAGLLSILIIHLLMINFNNNKNLIFRIYKNARLCLRKFNLVPLIFNVI